MISADIADPQNRRILAVAEDQLLGFHERPFAAIGERCGLPEEAVLERLRCMLSSGAILRLRQILPSTALTQGCLIAWRLPEERLDAAFDWLRDHDPATGHIVIRQADAPSAPGADYRLWTTLKLPLEADLPAHCRQLAANIGATDYACMPVVGMFSLSVGHVRRAGQPIGALQPEPPTMQTPPTPQLTPQERLVLQSFRAPLAEGELVSFPWAQRAAALGLSAEEYSRTARALTEKRALGRFAVVVNHTLPANPHTGTGKSALLMWAVPVGMEEPAGATCGQHICMTHCYWRSGAERFGGVQIMGVVHAPTREGVLAHKAAIDSALQRRGIPLLHTAAFHTVRAHIRPSSGA